MKPKKAPCVDVRTDVHKDVRFEVLGELAGYNRFEAIGRMHALWSWCVDRGLQDAPDDEDGHVVSEAVVRRFLGPNGVAAILGDGCDEFALGEARGGGRVYLRGTSEYVADRRARALVASAGGSARADSSRDQAGRFVTSTTESQPARHPASSSVPAAEPAAIQPTPASSSSPSPSESQTPAPCAPAIPQDAVKATIDMARDRLNAMRSELAEANSWTGVHQLHFMDPGFRELRARILECGPDAEQRVNHVLEVAFAEARAKNTVEYLTGSMFELRSWRKKLGMRVEDAARPRAGPRGNAATYGSSKPRTDHPEQPGIRSGGEVF